MVKKENKKRLNRVAFFSQNQSNAIRKYPYRKLSLYCYIEGLYGNINCPNVIFLPWTFGQVWATPIFMESEKFQKIPTQGRKRKGNCNKALRLKYELDPYSERHVSCLLQY